jgi:transposase
MIDGTTLLFALPGFRVLNVILDPDGGRVVLVESVAVEGGCPSCGVMSSRVKDRPTCRLKDLPHGSVPLRLWVCKRRFVCAEQLCSRRSFTEVSDQVPARSRLTTRLRRKVSAAVTATNRAMSEVAADYGVAWWTVHRILAATAVQVLGQAAPTTMIGIDETRARSVRWFHKETGWARSDPWMTSIVNLDPDPAWRDHRACTGPFRGVCGGLDVVAEQGVPRRCEGGGDRPVRSVCVGDPPGVAPGQDRPSIIFT